MAVAAGLQGYVPAEGIPAYLFLLGSSGGAPYLIFTWATDSRFGID